MKDMASGVALIEREIRSIQAPDLPCEYSSKNNPHPPIEADGFFCDGYGHMIDAETGAIRPERCECFLQWKSRRMVQEYLDRLPDSLTKTFRSACRETFALGVTLDTWKFKNPAVAIYGPPGTGKTLAGHVLMIDLIRKTGFCGIYWNTSVLADDLKRLGLKDPAQKVAASMRILERMDQMDRSNVILFLDDLGRERYSPATADEVSGIIRKAYERRSPLILTTNFSSAQLRDRYGSDVLDRITDNSWMTMVKVEGHSGRRIYSGHKKLQNA